MLNINATFKETEKFTFFLEKMSIILNLFYIKKKNKLKKKCFQIIFTCILNISHTFFFLIIIRLLPSNQILKYGVCENNFHETSIIKKKHL